MEEQKGKEYVAFIVSNTIIKKNYIHQYRLILDNVFITMYYRRSSNNDIEGSGVDTKSVRKSTEVQHKADEAQNLDGRKSCRSGLKTFLSSIAIMGLLKALIKLVMFFYDLASKLDL